MKSNFQKKLEQEVEKELSLVSIFKGDVSFSERIKYVSEKIQQDKNIVNKMADKYSKKYERQIAEGTEQEKLLLTEGSKEGLSRDETMIKYGRFLPTIRTPVLNWLYFFMKEENQIHPVEEERSKKSRFITINIMLDRLGEDKLDWNEFRNFNWDLINDLTDKTSEYFNKNFGNSEHSGLNSDGGLIIEDEAPEMMEYLYGNLTIDTFNKLKKLKNLTQNPNKNEAFEAYQKCIKLCKKYNLEFDRIPV